MVPLIAIEAIGAGFALGLTRRALEQRFSATSGELCADRRRGRIDRLRDPAARSQCADGRGGAVGQAQRAGSRTGHGVPRRSAGRQRRSWPAWDRSGTTCRKPRAQDSTARFPARRQRRHLACGARRGPRPFAEWVLIEEKAEGGDMLAHRARESPHFLDGYSRVCEGAGLALYKRQDPRPNSRAPSPQPLASSPLEPEAHREQIVVAAEIDLRSGEALIVRQVSFSRLVPDFEADAGRSDRHAHAAEDRRPSRARRLPTKLPVKTLFWESTNCPVSL